MSSCRHYKVSGLVQGVFYRAATRDKANELGLSGWVRNMPDGSVELVARGSEALLDELQSWLWQGPRHAQVTEVAVREAEAESFNGFEVRY